MVGVCVMRCRFSLVKVPVCVSVGLGLVLGLVFRLMTSWPAMSVKRHGLTIKPRPYFASELVFRNHWLFNMTLKLCFTGMKAHHVSSQ